MENQDNQINIELSAEVAEGTYSNLAIISHSTSEFVVDFVRMMPGTPKANVKSRIILTPEHAKRLLFALQDNISRFSVTVKSRAQLPSRLMRSTSSRFFIKFSP